MHFAALGPVLCTLFALCFPEGQSRPHHRVLEIGGRERGFDVGMRCARLPGAVHGAISTESCKDARQWPQRMAVSGFSRPHEGHFMVEGFANLAPEAELS